MIPVVDLSLPLEEVGRQVCNACTSMGFFHLVGHGLSDEIRTQVLEESRNMFRTLTDQQKNDIHISRSQSYRGYQAMFQNVTKEKRDGHEALDLWSESELAQNHSIPTNYGHNQWPNGVPQLRTTIELYLNEMIKISHRLMQATAVGLGIGQHYFDSYFTDPFWGLRLIHYPSVSDSAARSNCEVEEIGVGEHTDYGNFTLILCDEGIPCPTLQIKQGGKWTDVNPIPGGFICNIGDMLARWTNNIFVATPHRVLRSSHSRVSVPFFYEPNCNAYVKPIPELVGSDSKPCFEPVVYGDHGSVQDQYQF